jgi:hypothetical protein
MNAPLAQHQIDLSIEAKPYFTLSIEIDSTLSPDASICFVSIDLTADLIFDSVELEQEVAIRARNTRVKKLLISGNLDPIYIVSS